MFAGTGFTFEFGDNTEIMGDNAEIMNDVKPLAGGFLLLLSRGLSCAVIIKFRKNTS